MQERIDQLDSALQVLLEERVEYFRAIEGIQQERTKEAKEHSDLQERVVQLENQLQPLFSREQQNKQESHDKQKPTFLWNCPNFGLLNPENRNLLLFGFSRDLTRDHT